MTTLRKNDALINRDAIRITNNQSIPSGTHFYCQRGGKSAKVSYYDHGRGAVMTLTEHNGMLAGLMAPIELSSLNVELRRHFGLDASAVRKGDFKSLGQPLNVSTGKNQTVEVPAGTRLKVLRGGTSPRVLMMIPGHQEFSLLKLFPEDTAMLVDASPIGDDPRLSRITSRVKVIADLSEETKARSGTVSLDGQRLEVKCYGHGDSLFTLDIDEGASTMLANLLCQVLRDAEVTEHPGNALIEQYLDFISGDTYGMETFVTYTRHRQATLRSLTEKYGR